MMVHEYHRVNVYTISWGKRVNISSKFSFQNQKENYYLIIYTGFPIKKILISLSYLNKIYVKL